MLAHHKLLGDRKATSYPAFQEKLPNPKDERVVVDGNLITSQGPATSLEFAGSIIQYLCGDDESQKVMKAMLVQN